MKKITKTTLANDLFYNEDDIVNNILPCFDTRNTWSKSLADAGNEVEDIIRHLRMFIKDEEFIKTILKKVVKRIHEVRKNSYVWSASDYQKEIRSIIKYNFN